MASTIDILLDKAGGLVAGGSAPYGELPLFVRNDTYLFRLRILERNSNGGYTDASLESPYLTLGIGYIDATSSDGEFKLTTTTGTSTAISFNATTSQVLNAVSGIAGNVGVTTYNSGGSAWIITAATINTQLSFGSLPFTLFPESLVSVTTRKVATASVYAQQIVSLKKSPVVYTNTFSLESGDGISLAKVQDGSASLNETYALKIGNDVYGGSYSLAYGGHSIAIPYLGDATNVASSLSAITGIGANNISVASDSSRGLIITFVNQLGLQNVSTQLILDSSGTKVYSFYTSAVTLATIGMADLFNESSTDTIITPTLEIELAEAGQNITLIQKQVSISKDLLSGATLVPATIDLYYTQAQSNTLFPLKTSISASYYTKTEGDARYTTNTAISGSYYTKTEGDARYTTNTAISGSYYTKTEGDARYTTNTAISGSYYTKTESTNLFIQNTTGNVNATCRSLINSAAVTIFNYETGLIGYNGALQVPTSLASAITIQTNLSVSGSGSFNAICSSSITAYSMNVVSSVTISGNLTVIGAISASSLSFNTASFVLDSPLNVNASNRSLHSNGATMLSYSSNNVLIYPTLYCASNVGVCGTLLVHDNSSFLSSVIINPELTVNDNINIVCGGLTCVCGGISTGVVNVGTGGINNSGDEFILGSLVVCGNVSFNSVCLINTLSVSSVSSYQMSAITITTTALSATTVTAGTISTSCLNVTSGFRFGSVSAGACTYGVYTISSNIPNLTSITWQAINVCSNGNPATMYVLSGGATAPTFSIGYDNDLRGVVRNVLTAFGNPHFGFLNVTT